MNKEKILFLAVREANQVFGYEIDYNSNFFNEAFDFLLEMYNKNGNIVGSIKEVGCNQTREYGICIQQNIEKLEAQARNGRL